MAQVEESQKRKFDDTEFYDPKNVKENIPNKKQEVEAPSTRSSNLDAKLMEIIQSKGDYTPFNTGSGTQSGIYSPSHPTSIPQPLIAPSSPIETPSNNEPRSLEANSATQFDLSKIEERLQKTEDKLSKTDEKLQNLEKALTRVEDISKEISKTLGTFKKDTASDFSTLFNKDLKTLKNESLDHTQELRELKKDASSTRTNLSDIRKDVSDVLKASNETLDKIKKESTRQHYELNPQDIKREMYNTINPLVEQLRNEVKSEQTALLRVEDFVMKEMKKLGEFIEEMKNERISLHNQNKILQDQLEEKSKQIRIFEDFLLKIKSLPSIEIEEKQEEDSEEFIEFL